jgi:hypothetical protein
MKYLDKGLYSTNVSLLMTYISGNKGFFLDSITHELTHKF